VARELRPAVQTFHEAARAAGEAGDERTLARAEWGLGTAYVFLDQPDSAEAALRSGLERMATLDGYPEDEYLSAQTSLAGLLRRRSDLAGAEALYREIAGRQRASPTTRPMDYAATLNNLAVLRRMQGAFEEARGLYEEAIDTVTTILGAGHPQSLMLQGNLARVLFEMGREDESIALYRARVAAAREQWPQGHWQVADALMNLGASLVDARRPEAAVEPLTAAVAMAVSQIGDAHSWTHVYRGWLGAALQLAGREAEGEQWLRVSLSGLAQYEGLAGDQVVISRIQNLVQRMEKGGLSGPAGRYRELLERRPQSQMTTR
jgi:tetratricopeptide (TPR) repeat protein